MKIMIKDIYPLEVEDDLRLMNASQTYEKNMVEEYFDISESHPTDFLPFFIPREFKHLFKTLTYFIDTHSRLAEDNLVLYLYEENEQASLRLERKQPLAHHERSAIDDYNISFPYEEWANVEELLLRTGFNLVKKKETRKIGYHLRNLKADYELIITENDSFLLIQADDEERIVLALNMVGFSIDQGAKV